MKHSRQEASRGNSKQKNVIQDGIHYATINNTIFTIHLIFFFTFLLEFNFLSFHIFSLIFLELFFTLLLALYCAEYMILFKPLKLSYLLKNEKDRKRRTIPKNLPPSCYSNSPVDICHEISETAEEVKPSQK